MCVRSSIKHVLNALLSFTSSTNGYLSRCNVVREFRRGVTQHAFRTYGEDMDYSFRIGRNTRKVRAIEKRVLQCARFTKGFLSVQGTRILMIRIANRRNSPKFSVM